MDDTTEHIFLLLQSGILLLTLATMGYMVRALRGNRWYFRHALPLLVYSAHVAIYYLALIVRHQLDGDLNTAVMAWSIALRLHGAIMVLTMARTVIKCLRS